MVLWLESPCGVRDGTGSAVCQNSTISYTLSLVNKLNGCSQADMRKDESLYLQCWSYFYVKGGHLPTDLEGSDPQTLCGQCCPLSS